MSEEQGDGAYCRDVDKLKWQIMQEVNVIEAKARENEYSACKLVFGFITAYSLALPTIAISVKFGLVALIFVFIATLVSMAGVYFFLPVLMRPARQFREIKADGEKLIRQGFGSFCSNPEWWTHREKTACGKTTLCIILSVLFLFCAFASDRMAETSPDKVVQESQQTKGTQE